MEKKGKCHGFLYTGNRPADFCVDTVAVFS